MALYAVIYEWAGDPEARIPVRPDHRAFLSTLLEGELVVSGPLSGALTGAMFILNSASADAAAESLSSDPFQVGGFVARVQVSEWTPMTGPLVEQLATLFP
jgi:uncharacterized protein YciI